jgi:hypothetical protein
MMTVLEALGWFSTIPVTIWTVKNILEHYAVRRPNASIFIIVLSWFVLGCMTLSLLCLVHPWGVSALLILALLRWALRAPRHRDRQAI